MNPSYFRIKVNMKEAVERLCIWNGSDCKEWIETGLSDAVDVSLNENGTWKGTCLYVYEKDGWTIFEDLSGSYSFLEPDEWKKSFGSPAGAKGDEEPGEGRLCLWVRPGNWEAERHDCFLRKCIPAHHLEKDHGNQRLCDGDGVYGLSGFRRGEDGRRAGN